MNSHLYLIAADCAVGRVDLQSLSDQAMMELFVSAFNEECLQTWKTLDGSFREIEDWRYVSFEVRGIVDEICIRRLIGLVRAKGTVSLDFVPRQTAKLTVSDTMLEGTLQTKALPHSLRFIDLHENRLHGEVDFRNLPHELGYFDIQRNSFSGSVDLTALPENLKILHAGYNSFTGGVSLENLPKNMIVLQFQHNALTGEFSLINAPQRLRSVGRFSVESNQLEGVATVHSTVGCEVRLHDNAIRAVVNENGEPHERADEFLG